MGTVCNAGNAITELLCSLITGHRRLPRAHYRDRWWYLTIESLLRPPTTGGMVLSLIGELISHKPQGVAEKENRIPRVKRGSTNTVLQVLKLYNQKKSRLTRCKVDRNFSSVVMIHRPVSRSEPFLGLEPKCERGQIPTILQYLDKFLFLFLAILWIYNNMSRVNMCLPDD